VSKIVPFTIECGESEESEPGTTHGEQPNDPGVLMHAARALHGVSRHSLMSGYNAQPP
jgi:hypothetical protein